MKEVNRNLGIYLAIGEQKIYNYVYKYIHDVGISEQFCQDVCEEVFKRHKLNQNISEDEIYKLMYHIARCKVINYFKKSSTKYEELRSHIDMDRLPLPDKYDSDYDNMRVVLYENISKLREVEQKVIMGKIHNLTAEELAFRLNRSPHAVECIYSRAVNKLKNMIHKRLEA